MALLGDAWIVLRRIACFGVRVVSSFLRNRGILLAGGVGYNALLSLVPLLTLLVAALTLFFDEGRILDALRPQLQLMIPQHADSILQAVQDFLRNHAATSLLSVAALLFFSSIAFRMLEEAVAQIFHTSERGERRSFWTSALLPYLFLLCLMISLLFMTVLTSVLDGVGAHTFRILGRTISLEATIHSSLRLASFLALVLLFTGIYVVLPVVKISWRRALVGGLCAAVLWRLVGLFMGYYFANISMVSVIYGSLATVIVVLLLLEILFVIVLLAAQVIAELEASSAAGLRWYESPKTPETRASS